MKDSLTSPLLRIENLCKKFGEFYANRDVSLTVSEGEIHAVAGENGAGKTTLMNMLFGRLRPDSGSILLRGKVVSFRTPRDAILAGIGMVHQDILFFPQLTVLENIVLGWETGDAAPEGTCRKLPRISIVRGPAGEKIRRIQDSLGFDLDPDREAVDLSFAQRQQIELVRLLYRGARILILDEPTSLLSPDETSKFLDLMKSLRAGGRTILFISHRLAEVFAVADRITVLRKGSVAATLVARETDAAEIAGLMLGSRSGPDRGESGPRPPAAALPGSAPSHARAVESPPLLELHDVKTGPFGTEPALDGISMFVRKGEVFGIGGIVGNGQRLLARVLSGKIRPNGGSVRFDGEDISRLGIDKRIGKNIRWLPENLAEEALLPERSIWENLLLGRQWEKEFSRLGFIRRKNVLRYSEEQILLNDIAAPAGALEILRGLSGGNRQKVALARALAGSPRLVVLEQPCRGLDLHAAGAVHDRVSDLSRGKQISFVLISYDFDELISLCDRIAIIYRGKMMGTVERANAALALLGRWAAGIGDAEDAKEG